MIRAIHFFFFSSYFTIRKNKTFVNAQYSTDLFFLNIPNIPLSIRNLPSRTYKWLQLAAETDWPHVRPL